MNKKINILVIATSLALFQSYSFSTECTGPVGDVNADGKITTADTMQIFKHIGEELILTGNCLKKADVNGDGKVDIDDVGYSFNTALGKACPVVADFDTDGKGSVNSVDQYLVQDHVFRVSGKTFASHSCQFKNSDINDDGLVDTYDLNHMTGYLNVHNLSSGHFGFVHNVNSLQLHPKSDGKSVILMGLEKFSDKSIVVVKSGSFLPANADLIMKQLALNFGLTVKMGNLIFQDKRSSASFVESFGTDLLANKRKPRSAPTTTFVADAGSNSGSMVFNNPIIKMFKASKHSNGKYSITLHLNSPFPVGAVNFTNAKSYTAEINADGLYSLEQINDFTQIINAYRARPDTSLLLRVYARSIDRDLEGSEANLEKFHATSLDSNGYLIRNIIVSVNSLKK